MIKGHSLIGRLTTYAVGLFMISPLFVLFGASFSDTPFVAFPPRGFTTDWYLEVFADDQLIMSVVRAAGLGLGASLVTVALSVAFLLLQYRYPNRATDALSAYSLGPAMVPHVVLGVGLLFVLAQINMLGSLWALLVAHVVICLPFGVRAVSASVNAINQNTARAAAILGARPVEVFWKITLPALKPGLVGAFIMSFLTSFNNVAVSVFISNSQFRTFPVLLFQRTEDITPPSIAAASTLILLVIGAIAVLAETRFKVFSSMGSK